MLLCQFRWHIYFYDQLQRNYTLYSKMGVNGSRQIHIKNVEEHYNKCEVLGNKRCPIYGETEIVRYQGMEFNIGQSVNSDMPHPMSIHYLVMPHLLLIPDFVLLEEISPSSLEQLLQIIKGISEMAIQGDAIGIGHQRIAYRDRWGVVGQKYTNWTYNQVYEQGDIEGVYFSPQQMIQFSQNRKSPSYNPQKADIFSLGIMLVQIIFGQDLSYIYDYQNFEIRLNPLLQKLQRIKQEFGEEVSNMFISMLQIQEEDRVSFEELLAFVNELLQQQQPKAAVGTYMLNSNSSQRNVEVSRGNKTPGRTSNAAHGYTSMNRTPKADPSKYRNDVSPFRGRFGGAVKNNPQNDRVKKTPERGNESRSPMRRNNPGNAKVDRETFSNRCVPPPMNQDFQSFHRGISPLNRR